MKIDKKIYISIGAFIGVHLLLIVLVIIPLVRTIENNSKELLLTKEELIFFSDARENLLNIEDSFQEVGPDLEKIDTLLVDAEIPINFINFLKKSAVQSNVSLGVSLVGSRTIKEDPWLSLSSRLVLSGSFLNVMRFIDKLENSKYLIEIQELSIKKVEEEKVDASLTIKVFAK